MLCRALFGGKRRWNCTLKSFEGKNDTNTFKSSTHRGERSGKRQVARKINGVKRAKPRKNALWSLRAGVSAASVFINNAIDIRATSWPDTFSSNPRHRGSIITSTFHSFSVAGGDMGSCQRPELRVTSAHSAVAPVIPINQPTACFPRSIYPAPKSRDGGLLGAELHENRTPPQKHSLC